MVTFGDLERNGNYSNMDSRFRMPNYDNSDNKYYSFNSGNAHFVTIDLNFYNDASESRTKYPNKRGIIDWLK